MVYYSQIYFCAFAMSFIWLQIWSYFHFHVIKTGRKSLRLQAILTENLSDMFHVR